MYCFCMIKNCTHTKYDSFNYKYCACVLDGVLSVSIPSILHMRGRQSICAPSKYDVEIVLWQTYILQALYTYYLKGARTSIIMYFSIYLIKFAFIPQKYACNLRFRFLASPPAVYFQVWFAQTLNTSWSSAPSRSSIPAVYSTYFHNRIGDISFNSFPRFHFTREHQLKYTPSRVEKNAHYKRQFLGSYLVLGIKGVYPLLIIKGPHLYSKHHIRDCPGVQIG